MDIVEKVVGFILVILIILVISYMIKDFFREIFKKDKGFRNFLADFFKNKLK